MISPLRALCACALLLQWQCCSAAAVGRRPESAVDAAESVTWLSIGTALPVTKGSASGEASQSAGSTAAEAQSASKQEVHNRIDEKMIKIALGKAAVPLEKIQPAVKLSASHSREAGKSKEADKSPESGEKNVI